MGHEGTNWSPDLGKDVQENADAGSAKNQPGRVNPVTQQQRRTHQTERQSPPIRHRGPAEQESDGGHQGHGGCVDAIEKG